MVLFGGMYAQTNASFSVLKTLLFGRNKIKPSELSTISKQDLILCLSKTVISQSA